MLGVVNPVQSFPSLNVVALLMTNLIWLGMDYEPERIHWGVECVVVNCHRSYATCIHQV